MTTTTSVPDADEQRPTALPKDDAFHLLQNARRRAVLRHLLEHDRGEFVMRDVAEAVAAWEHDTTVRQLASTERQRVYIALYQSHLPKLDEHDVIDYDQGRGTIRPLPLLAVFEPFVGEGLHGSTEALTHGNSADVESTRSVLAGIVSLFS